MLLVERQELSVLLSTPRALGGGQMRQSKAGRQGGQAMPFLAQLQPA